MIVVEEYRFEVSCFIDFGWDSANERACMGNIDLRLDESRILCEKNKSLSTGIIRRHVRF